jgi:hypothetical protein
MIGFFLGFDFGFLEELGFFMIVPLEGKEYRDSRLLPASRALQALGKARAASAAVA